MRSGTPTDEMIRRSDGVQQWLGDFPSWNTFWTKVTNAGSVQGYTITTACCFYQKRNRSVETHLELRFFLLLLFLKQTPTECGPAVWVSSSCDAKGSDVDNLNA